MFSEHKAVKILNLKKEMKPINYNTFIHKIYRTLRYSIKQIVSQLVGQLHKNRPAKAILRMDSKLGQTRIINCSHFFSIKRQ